MKTKTEKIIVEFKVLPEHIKRGKPGSDERCPLALSVRPLARKGKRFGKINQVSAGTEEFTIWSEYKNIDVCWNADYPVRIRNWIENLDNVEYPKFKIKPISGKLVFRKAY